MAKALFATYLIALAIGLAAAYSKECAVGPAYWCKSFENAQDCGALRHCTDTVWINDNKFAVDPSRACQWCQKILKNTHKGLEDNEKWMASTLISGCKLLTSEDLSSKCTNIFEKYETSAIPLIKNKRYSTLCRLMNVCSSENSPVMIGSKRCTWGPSYWCSSLSNTRECNSIDHCSNQIWSQQGIQKKENDNICQYCEYIINQLRTIITENKTEVNVEKWLEGACSMLQMKEAIDECKQTMSQYAEEILLLIKNNIDAGIICHLGEMCKEATIVTREKSVEISDEEQSKMLCNAIVRATHDLHVVQEKDENEIETFLKTDCQKLSNSDLIRKCEDLVEKYGKNIYENVANNMELSKICDNTILQSSSHIHCDLCTFVMASTKAMLDANNSEDKVLGYIDENFCSHMNGDIKKNCKNMIENNGKDLISNIQQGKATMLLCTYFQVCFNELIDKNSPIKKEEIQSFLQGDICDHLGIFEESCKALMTKDSIRLLKTLVNDVDGDVLCQIFGICPMKLSLIDNLSIKDDTNKCKRCIDDYSRRKHIAEKLLNYSSEFLHHLCGQLSNTNECIKSVDEPINKLIQFIQSLNPKEICEELKTCDQESLANIQITSMDNVISKEVIVYIKNEVCPKIGPLSNWCNHVIDTEGVGLFNLISKDIDPHRVCSVLDICPTTTAFENCNDKCECCVSKIENYQIQLAAFLQTMLTTAEVMCKHMSHSEDHAKQICQTLTHCSVSPAKCDIDGNDKCQCCQTNLDLRQNNFHTTINEITSILLSFCTDDKCRSIIQSKQLNTIHSLTFCQLTGYCTPDHLQRSIPFLSNIMINTYSDFESSIEDLSDKICSNFDELKSICQHILASKDYNRYLNIYMALLKNNPELIDKDLREQSKNTCDGCKNAIQSSKDYLINSLKSVRDALLQTCDRCPVKDQCRAFFNQRFDNLTSYVNNINPEKFCQTIHLCSVELTNTCSTCIEHLNERKDGILQVIHRLTGYFNNLCQDKSCELFVQQLKDLIDITMEEFHTNQSCISMGFCGIDGDKNEMNFNQYGKTLQDDIEKNICSILGSFESLCKNIIHGNTEDIQKLEMKYTIEDLMNIGDTVIETVTDIDDENNGDECKCCIARIIRKKKRTKFIGNLIFSVLLRSCDRCPAKRQCRKYWRYAQARFDAHIDRICPKLVCIRLGYCNKTIEPNTTEIEEFKTNSTCILCDYVMNILSNYINRQSTEEEIEENLQKICQQIPSILQNQCREYIDNYGPAIISILLREFDLTTICQKLNLCTNQMKFDITHIIKANPASCGVCDYVSTYLNYALNRDSKTNALQQALSTVCTYLSDEQKPKCQIMIQLFSPYIRQLELNSKNNFCKQLTICQTPMSDLKPGITIQKEPLIPINPHETPQCTLCHYVISYLDAALKNNKSEQAVEEALKKVCTILPQKLRGECNQFITTYGSVIAELIAGAADPDTICRYIGVCKDFSSTTVIQTAYTCSICQYIINRMKYFAGLNQEKNDILVSVKDSCSLYNVASLQEECKDFLNQYGLYFSQKIFNNMEQRNACQNIGICNDNYSSTSPAPTKYGKCIFGMNYWCTSHANAELCNAVELCEREVWLKKKNPMN